MTRLFAFLFLFVCLLMSCHNRPKSNTPQIEDSLSNLKPDSLRGQTDCINEKIEYFKDHIGVKMPMSQIFTIVAEDQEVYYVFDQGMAMDLPAYILNSNCDTVCITGGMRRRTPEMKECPTESPKSRQIIWSNQPQ